MGDHERSKGAIDDPGSEALATSLLHASVPVEDRPRGSTFLVVLVSLFIAYHAAVLLVYNLPPRGLTRGLFMALDRALQLRQYVWTTGIDQSWGLFAPDPVMWNEYMRVNVVDLQGASHDLAHDTYGRQSYPYLFYSRMRDMNRKLVEKSTFQRPYAAWVCRRWELDHAGEPAREVQLVELLTSIPPPSALKVHFGFDPMKLPLSRRTVQTVSCAAEPEAQLPPRLRARHGLPPAAEGTFKAARSFTWVDQRSNPPTVEPSN